MYRKLMALLLSAALLMTTADAKDYIRWVDFDVPTEALTTAMHFDIDSQGQELELDWIEILALAATRNGSGKLSSSQVKKAAEDLRTGSPFQKYSRARQNIMIIITRPMRRYWVGCLGAMQSVHRKENGRQHMV